MKETAAFVLCIENNAIRDQALLLIESIRTFAGAHKDAEIIAVSARGNGVDRATELRLSELGVRYVNLTLNRTCLEYGPANRVYAGAWAAQNTDASTLLVLDSDTIFFGEPELLGESFDFAARPVDLSANSSTGPASPFEDYLQALCTLVGASIDTLPFTQTTVDEVRIRSIYNTGYSVVRRDSGVLELAAKIFTDSVQVGLRPARQADRQVHASTGWVSPAGSAYWGSSQAVLAVATHARGQRVNELGRRYNVPLHLLARQKALDVRWASLDPLHVHYHWMLNAEHRQRAIGLLSIMGIAPEKLEWLVERRPLKQSN